MADSKLFLFICIYPRRDRERQTYLGRHPSQITILNKCVKNGRECFENLAKTNRKESVDYVFLNFRLLIRARNQRMPEVVFIT